MTLVSEVLARQWRLIKPLTTDVICERDLEAPMADGAVLLADRWAARASAATPQPSVLVRSPYGRRQIVGLIMGRLLAERGFQVVIQSVRGTFGSGGTFEPFDERADGLATLRWLRAQRWHRGPVGTIGPSYLGLVQWAIADGDGDAVAGPDALAIQVSASEFYDETFAGGSVSLETVASWLVIVGAQERRAAPIAINRGLRALQRLLPDSPLDELAVKATGEEVAWMREAFDNLDRDSDYWRRRDFSDRVPDVVAPVSFVGGWHDILLPWMLEDFKALQAAGRSPQLLIGPWTHISLGLAAVSHRDAIAWLRAHLLGDRRLLRASRIRVLVTGDGGGWRELERWPPDDATVTPLYLHRGGRLRSEPVAQAHEPGDGYLYDPADPTPSLGGATLLTRDPVVDNGPLERRPDVLTYTSDPLPEPLEAIGEVSATIWVSADPPHFDVFVRVCEVDRSGVSRNVCDGLASVDPALAERGDDGAFRVPVTLWPTAHRFAAGNRIRVQVSSGAHPRYARNPGTGENRARATGAGMRSVAVEVRHDGEHPSHVLLPVVG